MASSQTNPTAGSRGIDVTNSFYMGGDFTQLHSPGQQLVLQPFRARRYGNVTLITLFVGLTGFDECARTLRLHGAAAVTVLAVARTLLD